MGKTRNQLTSCTTLFLLPTILSRINLATRALWTRMATRICQPWMSWDTNQQYIYIYERENIYIYVYIYINKYIQLLYLESPGYKPNQKKRVCFFGREFYFTCVRTLGFQTLVINWGWGGWRICVPTSEPGKKTSDPFH